MAELIPWLRAETKAGARASGRRQQISAQELIATPTERRAQINAAYRRAVRDARAAGREPPKRKSIARRFQRYADATRRPSKKELTKMLGVRQRAQRKARSEGRKRERELRQNGGLVTITADVSINADYPKHGKKFNEVMIGPREFSEILDALQRGDDEEAREKFQEALANNWGPSNGARRDGQGIRPPHGIATIEINDVTGSIS